MTDKERIEKFIVIADDVVKARFFQESKNITYKLEVEVGKKTEQHLGETDEFSVRSLVMDLRLLTLQQDGVKVEDICDLLIKNTKNVQTKNNVEEWKRIYTDFLAGRPALPLEVDGKSDTNWEIIEKWIYSKYSHRDKKHIDALNALGFGEPIHRFNFLTSLNNFRVIVASIANNAKLVLSELSLS